jgi:serine/threonine protein kinase
MSKGTETTRVAERYSLRTSLGSGGMGEVWLARDELLHRDVAVKAIGLPRALTRELLDAAKERVLREARAAARINHANAVIVYDVFEEGDRAYIVMELIDAPTLADRVASDGPLAPSDAARIGLEVLGALEAAHREGITHRDVKPSNVMLPSGGVKLADFGIASIGDDPRLTETGLVLGSPQYMAPEQATSGTAGPEADLWALGATLYYAVEGRPPFDKGHSIATLTSVVHDELAVPSSAGALGPVISALMAKDPAARPDAPTARGLLERVAAGEATTVPAPAPAETRGLWP